MKEIEMKLKGMPPSLCVHNESSTRAGNNKLKTVHYTSPNLISCWTEQTDAAISWQPRVRQDRVIISMFTLVLIHAMS